MSARKRSPRKPGESKVFYMRCRDAAGQVSRHRVKLTAKGRLSLLDHAHGEPEQTLCLHQLAGVIPGGCYTALRWMRMTRTRSFVLWQQGVPDETRKFCNAVSEAANGVNTIRATLRAQAPIAARVKLAPKWPVWIVSQDAQVVRAIVTRGEPSKFMLWAGKGPYVATTAGFIKVQGTLGAIIWDAGFPGVSQIVAQGVERGTPGMLALVRLTDQLLKGWRGVLRE